MIRRRDEHERLHVDDLDAQPVWRIRCRQADDHGVVVIASDTLDERQGLALIEGDLHSGVCSVERGEQAGQVDAGDAGDGSKLQPPTDDPVERGERGSSRVAGRQRVAGMREQRAACRGESWTSAGAIEQRCPKFGLQAPDLLADSRLSHMQARGGAGEALLVGNGDEVGELAQLHR